MYLSSFRVTNYKSFLDSGKVQLEPGFNVIVGQNNTGKTALAQALSLRFSANPHRSTTTIPSPGTSPDPTSCAEVAFHLDTDDVKELLQDNLSTRSYYVAAGPDGQGEERLAQTFLDLVSEGPTIEATFVSQQSATSSDLRDFGLRGYGVSHGHGREVFFEVDSETGELKYLPERNGSNAPQTSTEFAVYLAQMCRESIYVFGALRFGVQENVVGPGFTLSPDAGNLVQVLNLLYNTRPNRWRKYLEGVRCSGRTPKGCLPKEMGLEALKSSPFQSACDLLFGEDHRAEYRRVESSPLSLSGWRRAYPTLALKNG